MPTSAARSRDGRLPWQRSEGGFVAHPEGNASGYARLERRTHLPVANQWWWEVRCADAVRSGTASSKQAAADEATAAWPVVAEECRATERAAMAQRLLTARLDEIASGMPYGPEEFGIEAADKGYLTRLIGECRARWEPAFKQGRQVAGIEKLMNEVSLELFRRRVGG